MEKIERYKRIVSAIENLGTTEVQELFRLLHKNDCRYTSNNNGIFINLNWASEDLLEKIERYIYFCNQSNQEVRRYESLQDVLNKKLHHRESTPLRKKPGADEPPATAGLRHPKKVLFAAGATGASATEGTVTSDRSRVSSSMRFYLLKKRYAKQVPPAPAKNDISKEPYPIP